MVSRGLKAFVMAAALGMGVLPAAAQSSSLTLGELAPQPLERDQCGLFLWSLGERPALILVAYDNPTGAVVSVDGRERFLNRTAFGGERTAGMFERQTFAGAGMTVRVTVSYDPERPIRDGAVVKEARIVAVDRDGWETVIPAGGMSGCQRREEQAN